MIAAYRPVRALSAAALFSTLTFTGACDVSEDSLDADLELEPIDDDQPVAPVRATVDTSGWETMTRAELAAEAGKLLNPESVPQAIPANCQLESWVFRTTENTVAFTGAPGQLLPPSPDGIPTFDDPALADGFIAVVTIEDVNGNIVGFASEQEILDVDALEADTTYTLTIPGRGTLMLEQRESFEILVEAVSDMVLDGELQRTFNPPITEVLTVQGVGKVIGGTDEFFHETGIWLEIGTIHGIDLINNTFDLEVMIQTLHC